MSDPSFQTKRDSKSTEPQGRTTLHGKASEGNHKRSSPFVFSHGTDVIMGVVVNVDRGERCKGSSRGGWRSWGRTTSF